MGSLVVGFILKCIPEEKDLDVKNFLNKEKNLKFFYFSLGLKKKKVQPMYKNNLNIFHVQAFFNPCA